MLPKSLNSKQYQFHFPDASTSPQGSTSPIRTQRPRLSNKRHTPLLLSLLLILSLLRRKLMPLSIRHRRKTNGLPPRILLRTIRAITIRLSAQILAARSKHVELIENVAVAVVVAEESARVSAAGVRVLGDGPSVRVPALAGFCRGEEGDDGEDGRVELHLYFQFQLKLNQRWLFVLCELLVVSGLSL